MPDEVSLPEDFERQVEQVTRALKSRCVAVPDHVLERTVREAFAERQDARIKDFVSLLAERSARERLRRLSAEQSRTVA